MSDLRDYILDRKKTDADFCEGFDAGYDTFKLGVMVKELRMAGGMTQEELAQRLNTKKTVVSRMENHSADMRVSTLVKIASVFGKKVQINLV